MGTTNKSFNESLAEFNKIYKKHWNIIDIYDPKYKKYLDEAEIIYNSFPNTLMKVSYSYDTDLEINISIGNTGQVKNRDPSLWIQSFPLVTVDIFYDEDDNEISFLVFSDSNPFDDAIESIHHARTFGFSQRDECIEYIKKTLDDLEKVKEALC